ncbi:diheme cytochrome c [Thiofilum flexile]|uniref:diheme cytochrome c n=1 Tax=Thiofilum flexile TaxID=125627 RepID=UPI000380C148|nr:diheme cytochrome c [Thiofilum flexile]
MRYKRPFLVALAFAGFISLSATLSVVMGDNDEGEEHEERESNSKYHEGSGSLINVMNEAWKSECSACHIAYPPNLLPRESWKTLMNDLGNHFGVDASLDKETLQEILPFLEQNASQRRVETIKGEPVIRITETAWFKHEHDEISSAKWKNPTIKSAANCMACHTQADKGNFDEDTVRIPR